jgi:hypothetical protein
VYQHRLPDAFAALLDVLPVPKYPKVYFFCLDDAMNADGQLSDTPMPANHVKMDSSVQWNILNVDAFRHAAVDTKEVQATQLQRSQAGRLNECRCVACTSCHETCLGCGNSNILRIATVVESQQFPTVADSSPSGNAMTPRFRHLKSPVLDPMIPFDDDGKNHNVFEEDELALEEMQHFA